MDPTQRIRTRLECYFDGKETMRMKRVVSIGVQDFEKLSFLDTRKCTARRNRHPDNFRRLTEEKFSYET